MVVISNSINTIISIDMIIVVVVVVIACVEKFAKQCTIVFHTVNTIISDNVDFDRLYKTE